MTAACGPWHGLRQRPVASLLLCVLLLVITWTSIAFELSAEHEEAHYNAMRETANRAQLFEDLAVRTLRSADESLQYVAARYLVHGCKYDLEHRTTRSAWGSSSTICCGCRACRSASSSAPISI